MRDEQIFALVALSLLIVPGFSLAQESAPVDADSVATDPADFRGGQFRLGRFFVENISTQIFVGPADSPFGIRLDSERDLGLSNSLASERMAISYRFGRRSRFSAEYFSFKLDGGRSISVPMTVGGLDLEVGSEVEAVYDASYTKIAYDYIFHDEGKIAASLVAGIHVSDLFFRIGSSGDLIEGSSDAGGRAPLPVIGGMFRYRVTPRLDLIARTDLFLLHDDDQSGSMSDSYLIFEHQTFDRISFGGGFNRFSLDIEIVDEANRWDWHSSYTGFYAFMGVQF